MPECQKGHKVNFNNKKKNDLTIKSIRRSGKNGDEMHSKLFINSKQQSRIAKTIFTDILQLRNFTQSARKQHKTYLKSKSNGKRKEEKRQNMNIE